MKWISLSYCWYTEADRFGQTKQLVNACPHNEWSKTMFQRFEKMVEKPNLMKGKTTEINWRISLIEQQLAEQNVKDDKSESNP